MLIADRTETDDQTPARHMNTGVGPYPSKHHVGRPLAVVGPDWPQPPPPTGRRAPRFRKAPGPRCVRLRVAAGLGAGTQVAARAPRITVDSGVPRPDGRGRSAL